MIIFPETKLSTVSDFTVITLYKQYIIETKTNRKTVKLKMYKKEMIIKQTNVHQK